MGLLETNILETIEPLLWIDTLFSHLEIIKLKTHKSVQGDNRSSLNISVTLCALLFIIFVSSPIIIAQSSQANVSHRLLEPIHQAFSPSNSQLFPGFLHFLPSIEPPKLPATFSAPKWPYDLFSARMIWYELRTVVYYSIYHNNCVVSETNKTEKAAGQHTKSTSLLGFPFDDFLSGNKW